VRNTLSLRRSVSDTSRTKMETRPAWLRTGL
jgi:hypothetical protein